MKRKYKIPETLTAGDQQGGGGDGSGPRPLPPRRRGPSLCLSLCPSASGQARGPQPQHGLSKGAALGRGHLKTALFSFLKKSSGL